MNQRLIPLAGTLGALAALAVGMTGCQSGSLTGPSPADPPAPQTLQEWQAGFPDLPDGQRQEYAAAADRSLESPLPRTVLGEYRLQADLTTGSYLITPLFRTTQDVLDVTAALNNPACPNGQCVDFVLNRRDSQTGFTSYTIFIYNPSNRIVYDVRFIWNGLQDADRRDDGELDTSNDVIILNPQGWTSEFDDWEQANGALPVMAPGIPDPTAFQIIDNDSDPFWPVINPFNVLGGNFADRSLPPREASFGEVQATVKTDTMDVTFLVTASVAPDSTPNTAYQRQDPFEFSKVELQGLMDDNINGRVDLRATVRDHQCDIGFAPPGDPDPTHEGVEFNSPSFFTNTPDDIQQMVRESGTCEATYRLTVMNDQGLRTGKYTYYIRAHSDLVNPAVQMQGWDLYWKGQITIVRDPSGGGGGGGAPANTIAYVSTERGNRDIFIDRVGGGFKTNLNVFPNDPEGDGEDTDPVLSTPFVYPSTPPGSTKRFIAWASNRGTSGNYKIYIWDLNPSGALHTNFPLTGGRPLQVTSNSDDCLAPAWSPNNDFLACHCRDSRGRFQIREYPINIDQTNNNAPFIGQPIWLTSGNWDNMNPSYSRGGQYLAFDSTRVRADNPEIYVMTLSGGTITRITFNTRE
ncbi:MAG TPA: hypothetical protein VEI97_02980, partial [bacterium]|nr:hypothetical protein [bacterium]